MAMFNSHVKFRHSLQLNWRMEKPWRMAQPHVLSKRPWKPWKPWTSPAPRRSASPSGCWLKLHPSFPGKVFHISMGTSSHHPYFNAIFRSKLVNQPFWGTPHFSYIHRCHGSFPRPGEFPRLRQARPGIRTTEEAVWMKSPMP